MPTKTQYQQLIFQYIEIFGEGPPLFGLDEDEAIAQMQQAIDSGEEMPGVDMSKLPPDAIL